MNLRDEEVLQRYFERQMTSAEEQNFLIDVAARDDMRLAFRSQLELLKVVRADKDAMAGAALVRNRTLTALGLGAALIPNALKEKESAETAASLAPATRSLWSYLRHPLSMLAAGLIAGAGLMYSISTTSSSDASHTSTLSSQKAPSTLIITEPAPAVSNTAIPQAGNASVQNTQHQKSNAGSGTISHVKPAQAATTAEPTELPVIKTSKSSGIQVNTKIHKEGDEPSNGK